ncbi:hypothetical protein D3C81_1261860 [compost metagenome]
MALFLLTKTNVVVGVCVLPVAPTRRFTLTGKVVNLKNVSSATPELSLVNQPSALKHV